MRTPRRRTSRTGPGASSRRCSMRRSRAASAFSEVSPAASRSRSAEPRRPGRSRRRRVAGRGRLLPARSRARNASASSAASRARRRVHGGNVPRPSATRSTGPGFESLTAHRSRPPFTAIAGRSNPHQADSPSRRMFPRCRTANRKVS